MMTLKRKQVILSLLLMALLLPGLIVHAVLAGQIALVPSLDVAHRYDDNYFKTENNKKSIHTTTVRPGIVLGALTPRSSASLRYFMNINQYRGESGIDDKDFVGHLAILALKWTTDHIDLGINNNFTRTRNSAVFDEFTDSVARVNFSMNRFSPNLKYRFGKRINLGARYTHLKIDYRGGTGEDSEEQRGTISLDYNLNSTLSLGLDSQVWTQDYDGTSSGYESKQLMGVLKKDYKHFMLFAGAGYHKRDFDHPDLPDIGDLTWKISFNSKSESPINVTLNQNYNNVNSDDNSYRVTQLSFKAGHVFSDRMALILNGMYQATDYEYTNRQDDNWSLGCRVNYQVNRVFSFAVGPGFDSRDSNEPGNDYDNSYILFNGRIMYNLGSK